MLAACDLTMVGVCCSNLLVHYMRPPIRTAAAGPVSQLSDTNPLTLTMIIDLILLLMTVIFDIVSTLEFTSPSYFCCRFF